LLRQIKTKMSEDKEMLSVRTYIPKFNGEQDKFQIWWAQFKAHCSHIGVIEAIGTTRPVNLPTTEDEVIDLSKKDGKLQNQARKANATAMVSLTLAFTKNSLLGMIYSAESVEYPNGEAWKVVSKLMKKCKPDNFMASVELEEELAALSMGRKDDPEELFEEISILKNKYSRVNIEEVKLMATVISKAPSEYASTIQNERRRLGTKFDMETLEEVMQELWKSLYAKSKEKTTTIKEMQL